MNTIWLKIAGGAVLLLVVVIGVASFMGGDSGSDEPKAKDEPKTVYDKFEEDRQNHPVVAPKPVEEEPTQVVSKDETPAEPKTTRKKRESEPETPKFVYVKPMQDFEEMQAQQLLSWAGTTYSIGRLPIMQYGNAVRSCRDVIERWPESWYAYQAKRILNDIAETSSRYRTQYKLTDELLDVSKFYEKRPGTQQLPLSN